MGIGDGQQDEQQQQNAAIKPLAAHRTGISHFDFRPDPGSNLTRTDRDICHSDPGYWFKEMKSGPAVVTGPEASC